MRSWQLLSRGCIIAAAFYVGATLGGGASMIVFWLSYEPNKVLDDGFLVMLVYATIGTSIGWCGGLLFAVKLIRRLNRSAQP